MFNDDVITHGPAAMPHPATAALNPSLFAAAPAVSSRLQLRRDDSMDSTSSTDSSITAVGGVSPDAFSSGEMSQSLGSSSSSTASVVSVSGSHVSGHSIVYGFNIPSKQQQQLEDMTPAVDESFCVAEGAAYTAAEPLAAAVAGTKSRTAAGLAEAEVVAEDSIKAVYPTPISAASAVKDSFTVKTLVVSANSHAKEDLLLTQTPSLPIPGGQQQKQKPSLSSNSMTTQILVANGYGKPRVVKLGGSSSGNPPSLRPPAGSAAPPVATTVVANAHFTTATSSAAQDNQRVCCGRLHGSSSSLKRRRGMFETFKLPGDPVEALKVRPGCEGAKPGAEYRICGAAVTALVEPKSIDVKGLAAVVAEYKDTVLRVGVNPRQETRVVAGRRVVRLCSSPGHVIQGFVREGARAA